MATHATFIECSASAGPGTLLAHGVICIYHALAMRFTDYTDQSNGDGELVSGRSITATEYLDFIAIHGGERAV